jgi:tRNA A37 methylthiotransferase MiaB
LARARAKQVHVVSGRVECPESQHLAACLERYFVADGCELVGAREQADIVVLNGCERIAETPRVVAAYLDFARRNPGKNVLCVGCVPKDVADSGGVENFHLVPFWKLVKDPALIGPRMGFSSSFSLLKKDDIFHGRFPLEEDYPGNPSPDEICLLTIGSGCLGGCTFCTIKRGRGRNQSLPPDEILAEAKGALAAGKFRFVLLADDAGCWGRDLHLDLPWLLGQLVDLCADARFLIRPMSPAHLPGMFERLRPFLPRVDYVYLPLQSASDRILRLMKRGHEAGPVLDLLRVLRADHPGVTLKTDFIVGFPSETREEFRESVHASRLFHHSSFHRFLAYPGTPAAKLAGPIDPQELDLRMGVIRRLGFTIVDPSTYSYDLEGEVP